MNVYRYFHAEVKNGKTHITAKSRLCEVLGRDGWISIEDEYSDVIDGTCQDPDKKQEYRDLVRFFGHENRLYAEVILDTDDISGVSVRGRCEDIAQAERKSGIKPDLLREMIWVDGAENISGVIILPHDDYDQPYIIRRENDEYTITYPPEGTDGDPRPYYEKRDGKTYIYVDGFSGGSGTQQDHYLISDVHELQAINNNLNAHYALANNIDASDTATWNGGAGFEPIGDMWDMYGPFEGSFDGRGHVISNLYINRPTQNNIGLFGWMDYYQTRIRDIGLESLNIIGRIAVGGLIGGCIEGVDVSGCYASGTISGLSSVGGLVGYFDFDAVMSNCYTSGSVSGTDSVGGLIGQTDIDAEIKYSYSTAAVAAQSNQGGLIGFNYDSQVTSSYWDTEASGQTTSAGGEGKTTAEMMQQSTFVGWDFDDIWKIHEGSDYPKLRAFAKQKGSGTKEDPYIIRDIVDLQNIKNDIFAHYALGNDIDAYSTATWNNGEGFEPIYSLLGSLDGRGHVITGLHINRPNFSNIGLFSELYAEIKNLGLVDVSIVGRIAVGGIAGSSFGPIRRCFVTGNIEGYDYVGGLVGMFATEVSNSYSRATVYGNDNVGGLAGEGPSQQISYCYSTGHVSGTGAFIGGLVGQDEHHESYATSSYWDTEASGQTTSAGGEGRTTAQMKQKSTFIGWDFGYTWMIDEGNSYPRLQWEFPGPSATPIYPATNDVTSSRPVFSWLYQSHRYKPQGSFRIQIERIGDGVVYDTGEVRSLNHQWTPNFNLPSGNFRWRISVRELSN